MEWNKLQESESMRRKTPARWTLKNLRQFYFSKLKAKVVTDEYEYEEWEYQ